MIWKPSPKAIQAAAEAYISDKGITAVLEAAINVDRPIVDLSAIRTARSRQPAIAEQSRFMSTRLRLGRVLINAQIAAPPRAKTTAAPARVVQTRRGRLAESVPAAMEGGAAILSPRAPIDNH